MTAQELFKKAEKERAEEKLDQAIATYQEARQQALEEQNPWIAAQSLHMVGLIYWQKEVFDQADQNLSDAQQEFADLEGAIVRDRGFVALSKEDYSKAQALFGHSVDLLKNTKRQGHLGISLVHLSKIYTHNNDFNKAEELIREGLSKIEGSPDRFFESTGYYNLAVVQEKKGEKEPAIKSVEKSLEILNEVSSPNEYPTLRKERQQFLDTLQAKS